MGEGGGPTEIPCGRERMQADGPTGGALATGLLHPCLVSASPPPLPSIRRDASSSLGVRAIGTRTCASFPRPTPRLARQGGAVLSAIHAAYIPPPQLRGSRQPSAHRSAASATFWRCTRFTAGAAAAVASYGRFAAPASWSARAPHSTGHSSCIPPASPCLRRILAGFSGARFTASARPVQHTEPSSITPATARIRTVPHIVVCTGLRYAASQLPLRNSSAAMGAARTARCLHNDEMRAHAPCIAGPSRFAAFVQALRHLPLFTAARGAAQRALLFTTPAYVCAPAAPRVDPCDCDVLLTSSHWRSVPGSAAPATSVGVLPAPCYLAGTARVRDLVFSAVIRPICTVFGRLHGELAQLVNRQGYDGSAAIKNSGSPPHYVADPPPARTLESPRPLFPALKPSRPFSCRAFCTQCVQQRSARTLLGST
ncbi:hypothetical protein DFH08DRAFT_1085357 [Mycena albidolilacea]|uniref:Uncharacterized protein n=1 Tax=Mycena albidolilacea TaxID=1033008 RepID=A0AAD6ZHS9_9AGAR|nr:hypothetical protein DFH08DRAFT_1085357 [Mycena albidolilacea]